MNNLKTFERYFDLNDDDGKASTYEIIYEFGKPKAIKCNVCDMTSHNPNDILHKYCGNCEMFHEDRNEPMAFEEDEEYAELENEEEEVSSDEKPMYPSDMYNGKGPSEDNASDLWKEVETMIMDNKSTYIEPNFDSPYAGIENISDPAEVYAELSKKFNITRK